MLVGTDSSGSKGKHRAAGLGTALSLATFYPVYNVTFNQPRVWQPNWHLPVLPDGEVHVDNFIRAALDIAQYPFRREARRLAAWRVAMVEHNLVEPDSELADWVCEHNLTLENLSETETEDVLEASRQTLRKQRREQRQAQRDTAQSSQDAPPPQQDEDSSSSDEDTGYDGPVSLPKDTQFPMADALDDDGFVRVAASRGKKRLGRSFDVPKKACLENYSAVDMLEYALAEARLRGGQQAVDQLTRRMARERVSCLIQSSNNDNSGNCRLRLWM